MTAESKKWDIMISYNWVTGKKCAQHLYKFLTENGYKVWFDEKNLAGNLNHGMEEGVENSEIILLLISEEYQRSTNCKNEYTLAISKKKKIIPIKVKDYQPPKDSDLYCVMSENMRYELYDEMEEDKLDEIKKRILDKEIKKHIREGLLFKGM